MAGFNKVILLGNLTRDVELRSTQSGTAVGKFGMAINRRYSQNGESKESVCFVDCTAWGRQAEILDQYAAKGREILVEGRLEYSTWEDKDGGGKRSKLQVIVENFQFTSSRGGDAGESRGGGRRSAPQQQAGSEAGDSGDFDGIPF